MFHFKFSPFIYTLVAIFSFGGFSLASAHEPLFGLGPHTVGQYAWAIESNFERGEHGWLNDYELTYGITPDFAVTAAMPYVFSRDGRNAGFGDVLLRGKYRFLRRDVLNAANAFAFHWGIKLPTGSRAQLRGSGTTDYFLGLSFGHESRKNYAFADVRYQVNGSVGNIARGNVANFDVAYGIRPRQLEYRQPDLVLLIEVLGDVTGRNSFSGVEERNTGGYTLSIAPGFLFSYRNMMFKGGVKLAILDKLNGVQPRPGTEILFGVDVHMPPFK